MPETTKNYHRVPVKRKTKDSVIRTINLGKGIKALYDVKRKVILTYIFDKTKYTMKQAKEWVKKRKDSASTLRAVQNLSLLDNMNEFYEESRKELSDILSSKGD